MKKVLWILWKDLVIEFRSREVTGAMGLFALMVLVIFAFSFLRPGEKMPPEMIPGLVWVTIAFAGMLGLNHAFLPEKQNDSLMGLLLAPVGKSTIYLGKVFAHFIFLLLVEIIVLPLFFIFFNINLQGSFLHLVLVLFFGTIGFSGLGVFLSALAAHTRSNELLLPIILFPVLIPLFLAGVNAAGIVFNGIWTDPVWVGAYWSWFRLMVVYDIIFLTLALLLIDYVLEVQ